MNRRDFVLVCVLALLLGYLVGASFASDAFVVTVREQSVIDYRGIRHFDLITAKDGTRLSVMGDDDLDLIRALGHHNGQKVRIAIVPFAPSELER